MDRTLIDWVKGCGESKVIPIGFVVMLVIFGFWWFAESKTEQSHRASARAIVDSDKSMSNKERPEKENKLLESFRK